MTSAEGVSSRGFGELLTRAAAWLVEPVEVAEPAGVDLPAVPELAAGRRVAAQRPRRAAAVTTPGIAVSGLVQGAGATTVARALAAELSATLGPLAPCVVERSAAREAGADADTNAERAVLVVSPTAEPALAELVARSLAERGPDPIVVLNRALEPGAWEGRFDVLLRPSPLGARLARAGWRLRGSFGPGMDELVSCCARR